MLIVRGKTRPWQSLLMDQSWLRAASFGGKSNFRQAFYQQNIVSAFLLGFWTDFGFITIVQGGRIYATVSGGFETET